MYCCHSTPESYNLFSADKLSIRSFCFISAGTANRIRLNLFNQWFLCLKRNPEGSNFPYNISGGAIFGGRILSSI